MMAPATGSDIADVPSNYKETARLEKPVGVSSIINTLKQLDAAPG
jgi:hypothetical protein